MTGRARCRVPSSPRPCGHCPCCINLPGQSLGLLHPSQPALGSWWSSSCKGAVLAHLWCPCLINDLKSNGKLKLGKDLPSLTPTGQLRGAVQGWDIPTAALLPRTEPEAAPPHRTSLRPGPPPPWGRSPAAGAEPWGLLAGQSLAKLVTRKVARSETCSGAGFIRWPVKQKFHSILTISH